MRITVFGAGRMGAIRVEDLAADPRVDEILVTNRTEGRAAALAQRYGATAIPWSQASGVASDATVIAVGTDAHDTLLEAVVRRGQPILCEKPVALSLAATERAIAHAERHGAAIQVGFQRRHDPGIRRLHDHMSDGRIGVVYSMTMTSHDHVPSPREFILGSGGIFRDMHVHDFDLIRWLTGSEVATVCATQAVRTQQQYAEFGDADATAIHAVTSSGVQIALTGARHNPTGHDVRMEVHGSRESLSAGLNQRTPLHPLDGDLPLSANPYTGFVDRFRDAFRNETASFVSLALGELAANPCPPEAALESLRVAIACERSVRSGLPVHVVDVTSATE